jgi:hypothetical protein
VTNLAGGGSGNVVGPASATDNAIARYDTTTGKLIQNSGATIDDSGNITATNLSGTNTGNQTTIVGITGTKAQFDTACTDGNFLYVGDVTQYTDEMAQDAVGAMVDASLVYVDATPLLQRAALTGDVTAAAGGNATTIANDAVTYAKMQNVSAASKLLGRGDSGSGDPQEITLGSGLTMTGTTLAASGSGGTITTQDEGSTLSTTVTTLNFVGAGVVATGAGATTTVTIAGGGGGSSAFTLIEKDLGTNPRRAGKFTVTGLAGLTITKPVNMFQAVGPYTNKGTLADEAEMDGLIVKAIVTAADTITAYWNSATAVRGNFKFNYLVGA